MEEQASVAGDPHVQDLIDRGYTVFERAYSPEEVAYLRGLLISGWERMGSPALRASPPVRPIPEAEIGPAGIVFHKLFMLDADIAPRLFKPRIMSVLRAVLGDEMRLELPAGVLSDDSRPFFDWHTHIDGVDDAYLNNQRSFEQYHQSQRVTHLLYLDDIGAGSGQLLVYPRAVTDPTTPPFNTRLESWEGEVVIECPAGSVVVIEQCTWHAARRKVSPGIRAFIGSYFRSGSAPETPFADATLKDWRGDDALFASLVRP